MNIDEQFVIAFLKQMVFAEERTKEESAKEKPKPEFEKSIKHVYEDDIEKLKEKLKSKIQETNIYGIEKFSIEKQPEQRQFKPLLPVPIPRLTSRLKIPLPPKKIEAKLPQPLKPIALDIEELNIFIQNPEITSIQCEGIDIPLKIAKSDEIVETDIRLNEEKIKNIIKKFSDVSGKPITEPVFKATFGNLTIMAIIAKSGTRFIIVKE